jgi:hypothetical protein
MGWIGGAVLLSSAVVTLAVATGSAQAHRVACFESVNPHGVNIPPAGQTPPGNGPGQNEDGFWLLSTPGSDGRIVVVDLGTGTEFGPYANGTTIKYTQAPGATPHEQSIGSDMGQAGAVATHIFGQGDMGVHAVGSDPIKVCLVPPPPK